jgi:hypothetical protein
MTTHVTPSTTTSPVHLRAWSDDLVVRAGWPVHSPYTELVAASVLGPSATLLLRHLAFELLTGGGRDPVVVDLEEVGRCLGLGGGNGRNSKLNRTLGRLVQLGYIKPLGSESLLVRTHVAPLSERQLARGGSRVRRLHQELMARKK